MSEVMSQIAADMPGPVNPGERFTAAEYRLRSAGQSGATPFPPLARTAMQRGRVTFHDSQIRVADRLEQVITGSQPVGGSDEAPCSGRGLGSVYAVWTIS